MTIVTSTTDTSDGTPTTPVTDHPIRFAAPGDVRVWLAGCDRLLPIAVWMGGERWGVRAWGLQQAARSGAPIPLENLEAIRDMIGLEGADAAWSPQALWLQEVDLNDPWVVEACALYETLEAACAMLRRAGRTSGARGTGGTPRSGRHRTEAQDRPDSQAA